MTKILVVYFSQTGHVERLAQAVAEGARSAEDTEVTIKKVPQLAEAQSAMGPAAGSDPEASVDELPDYDGIVFGSPTRFGNVSAQMREFLDQTGPLWAKGKLIGKVGSGFTSTASQHGGQETTLTSLHSTLLHLGMVVVGVPYSCEGLNEIGEISGGTPYGASNISGPDGDRGVSDNEQEVARFQGRHVATIAGRLARGAAAAESTDSRAAAAR